MLLRRKTLFRLGVTRERETSGNQGCICEQESLHSRGKNCVFVSAMKGGGKDSRSTAKRDAEKRYLLHHESRDQPCPNETRK